MGDGRKPPLIEVSLYDLQPGDIIIMDGLTAHKANPSLYQIYERSVLHFSPEWIKPVLVSLQMPELLAPFSELNHYLLRGEDGEERKAIKEGMKNMAALANEGMNLKRDEVAELKIQLIHVLLQIYKLSKKEDVQLTLEKSAKVLYVEEIAAFIQKHYREKITLDEIAYEIKVSKFYPALTGSNTPTSRFW